MKQNLKLVQTSKTFDQFIDNSIAVGDTLIDNGGKGLPDLNTLQTAAKFYNIAIQTYKAALISQKLSGETPKVPFLKQ